MNCGVVAVIAVLMRITFCLSQDKILDIARSAMESIVKAPGKVASVTQLNSKDAEAWLLQKDPIFTHCLEVPKAFCVGGTTKVITVKAVPEDLIGWWTFDEIYPVDHSGYGNHMHKAVRPGPAIFGHGASGAFFSGDSAKVAPSSSLNSKQFTVAFWIYILEDSTGSFRNIFSKGVGSVQQTTSILLYPNSRRLSVRVSTDITLQDGLSSIGTIPMRRWTHVAVTGSKKKLKIYINGTKDNEIKLKAKIAPNSFGIIIGSLTLHKGFEGYIDDVRYYRKALKGAEVGALTAPIITGIVDRNLVSIGCSECDYSIAVVGSACPQNYALCSLDELFLGGLHIARVNGWLRNNSGIWYAEISLNEVVDGEKRTALCCKRNSDDETAQTNQIEL